MKFTGERYIPCEETANQPIEREHWQRYYFARELFSSSSKLIDIASGEGYGSDFLAQKVAHVTGIDISSEAIEYAKKKYKRANLDFIIGDVEHMPIAENTIDGIVSFETIEHIDEMQQIGFLKEVKRVLKPNGIFIVSCPNKPIASDLAFELWGFVNYFHKKEYTINEFKQFLQRYFSNVVLLYQRTETNLILSSKSPQKLSVIWKEKKGIDDTQNIIAICSEQKIDPIFDGSIILDIDNSYQNAQRQLSDLNKDLKNEIEKRINVEKVSVDEAQKYKAVIEKQQQALEEYHIALEAQNIAIKEYSEQIHYIKTLELEIEKYKALLYNDGI